MYPMGHTTAFILRFLFVYLFISVFIFLLKFLLLFCFAGKVRKAEGGYKETGRCMGLGYRM